MRNFIRLVIGLVGFMFLACLIAHKFDAAVMYLLALCLLVFDRIDSWVAYIGRQHFTGTMMVSRGISILLFVAGLVLAGYRQYEYASLLFLLRLLICMMQVRKLLENIPLVQVEHEDTEQTHTLIP